MYSFFNPLSPGLLRKKITRSLFALFAVSCLSAVLFLSGCTMDPDKPKNLVGEWTTDFDSYTITDTRLEYFMEGTEWEGTQFPDTVLKGDIVLAVDFSSTSGVLIIRITEATTGNTVGKYTGVYYRDYTGSSIRLATAIGPAPDFSPMEADSLEAARTLFTVDNIDLHILNWAGITPYTK